MAKVDLSPIVAKALRLRARERLISIRPSRIIKVYPVLKGDYVVNKFEIRIKRAYVLSKPNPFDVIDKVLTAVAAFDMIAVHEHAQRIVRVKSQIMQQSAYLERTLSKEAYADFVHSLNHKQK